MRRSRILRPFGVFAPQGDGNGVLTGLRWILLAALLAGNAVASDRTIPLPRPDQQWIRVTSPNFTIISSAGPVRTEQVAQTLETVAGALRRVNPRFDARFTDTTVFLLNRRKDSQPYFELLLNQPRTTAPGAFIVQPDGSAAIVVDATRSVAADRTIKHELMHNILSASGTALPLWLEEGIAEYFSTTLVRGDSVIIGRPIIGHQISLRSRGVLPMDDVIAARHGSPIASHVLFYPQSWAIVEWMMRTNRKSFYTFVEDVERGQPVTEAFTRLFSMDIGTVARSFRTTAVRPSASSAMQIERIAVPVATAEISPADALYELGQFLGRMHPTRDDAERYMRAALEVDPAHARALAGIGTLRAYARKYEEAGSFFEKALELAPGDPDIAIAYAETLLQNVIGPYTTVGNLQPDAAVRYRRARELAVAAMAARPSPMADAIAGTSYLAENDVEAGISHLERAHAARPGRVDFSLSLYALYLRAGRREEAESLFDQVFKNARNPHAAIAARSTFVRENLLKANALAGEQRLEEAIALLEEAIAASRQQQEKADLTAQVEKLALVVETNRQVVAFNEAVAAFNRRDDAAAIEHLDRLLENATDPAIRERAARLRTTLRKRHGM